MKKKYYKNVDETVYETTLPNKMKVYLLYKEGFKNKIAYIVSRFGHFDSFRKMIIDGKKVSIPYGAAHFLEHRMFSINDIDANDLFSQLGASSNAYTTYEKTAYYFSCEDKFYENLNVLLTMVKDFTSTSEQIETEKEIILQEKAMGEERPSNIVLSKIYEQAYKNHPIRIPVIGTNESIKNTTVTDLKNIFDTFYDPSNLTLVVAGDINHLELEKYLNDNLLPNKSPHKVTPLVIDEPDEVCIDYDKGVLSTVTMPRFAMLLKLPAIKDGALKDKMYFCDYFILEYLFSSSGKLSEKWLKDKTLTSLIEYSLVSNIDLDCIIFYNINDNIEALANKLKEVFKKGNKLNMTQEEFDELKRSHYGGTIRAYESVGNVASGFVSDLFTSYNDYFLEIDEVRALTLLDIEEAFERITNASITITVLKGE